MPLQINIYNEFCGVATNWQTPSLLWVKTSPFLSYLLTFTYLVLSNCLTIFKNAPDPTLQPT